jgi:hypothetical protein
MFGVLKDWGTLLWGTKKHLIFTVLGAALRVLYWCFQLGATPNLPDLAGITGPGPAGPGISHCGAL